VNKRKWDGLTPEQRAILIKAGEEIEAAHAEVVKENDEEAAKQKNAGIQVINLAGSTGEEWRKKAYEAGWAGVVKQSPEHGPKLKEFFAKPQ
jgi:TRAP-type C4-dicarboxylate transport system substrate-binding protein